MIFLVLFVGRNALSHPLTRRGLTLKIVRTFQCLFDILELDETFKYLMKSEPMEFKVGIFCAMQALNLTSRGHERAHLNKRDFLRVKLSR